MKITLLTGRTFDFSAALGFEIKVTKSPRARKLTLRIDNKERIPALTIPRYCSNKKALEFVQMHQEWIFEHLNRLPALQYFFDGQELLLFGKPCRIEHHPEARRGETFKDGILSVSGEPEFLHRRVKDFIKKTAHSEFSKRSQKIATKLGCKINEISIKDTKSRWGSCSNHKNINYNWRVALAPEYVINYLVAHEVSHLLHQDHSTHFWDCVANICPQCGAGRNWLKSHSKELYMYL